VETLDKQFLNPELLHFLISHGVDVHIFRAFLRQDQMHESAHP
jgi:hypothetical protein